MPVFDIPVTEEDYFLTKISGRARYLMQSVMIIQATIRSTMVFSIQVQPLGRPKSTIFQKRSVSRQETVKETIFLKKTVNEHEKLVICKKHLVKFRPFPPTFYLCASPRSWFAHSSASLCKTIMINNRFPLMANRHDILIRTIFLVRFFSITYLLCASPYFFLIGSILVSFINLNNGALNLPAYAKVLLLL